MQCDPRFAGLLGNHRLDDSPSIAIGLWPDSRMAYLNRAYLEGAGGDPSGSIFLARWGLGARYLDACPTSAREAVAALFAEVLERSAAMHIGYLCPSPDTLREFRLLVYPLGRSEGLLAVHRWVRDLPPPEARPDQLARYRGTEGMAVQCFQCRCVRVAGTTDLWEFVPQYVAEPPPRTSHGLCPPCGDHYFLVPERASRFEEPSLGRIGPALR